MANGTDVIDLLMSQSVGSMKNRRPSMHWLSSMKWA